GSNRAHLVRGQRLLPPPKTSCVWQHLCTQTRPRSVLHVLNRSRIIRRVLIVVSVLLVSGAAAAMKLTSWTPANMCFCPTPDHPDSAVKSESGAEAILPAGSLRVPLDINTTAHSSSGALGSAPLVELAEKSSNGN